MNQCSHFLFISPIAALYLHAAQSLAYWSTISYTGYTEHVCSFIHFKNLHISLFSLSVFQSMKFMVVYLLLRLVISALVAVWAKRWATFINCILKREISTTTSLIRLVWSLVWMNLVIRGLTPNTYCIVLRCWWPSDLLSNTTIPWKFPVQYHCPWFSMI